MRPPRPMMAATASSTKFVWATLLTKGNDRDARRLHSMTLMALSLAMNWMLNGPVISRAPAISRPISRIRRMVSM